MDVNWSSYCNVTSVCKCPNTKHESMVRTEEWELTLTIKTENISDSAPVEKMSEIQIVGNFLMKISFTIKTNFRSNHMDSFPRC